MRLPQLDLENLTPAQAELSKRISEKRGATRGPFLIWLRSPELCEHIEGLASYSRFESRLPKRLRELALIMAARYFDAQYSWNAHAPQAIDAGIPAEAVRAIAEKREPRFDNREDAIWYRFANELLRDHFVSDEAFDDALQQFGEAALVDTIGALGSFTALGMCLNAFQVDLQDVAPPFPDVRGYAKLDAVASES